MHRATNVLANLDALESKSVHRIQACSDLIIEIHRFKKTKVVRFESMKLLRKILNKTALDFKISAITGSVAGVLLVLFLFLFNSASL